MKGRILTLLNEPCYASASLSKDEGGRESVKEIRVHQKVTLGPKPTEGREVILSLEPAEAFRLALNLISFTTEAGIREGTASGDHGKQQRAILRKALEFMVQEEKA